MKNNSANQDFTNNADGFDLSGGSTSKRKLTISGSDVSVVGSGSAVTTFPSSTSTLATRSLTETLTNKTIDNASNTILGTYFTMEFVCASSTPADGQTYYFGFPYGVNLQSMTSPARRQKIVSFACTLKAAAITVIATAGATNESTSLYARINDTTDVTLSTAITMNLSIQTFSVTGLSQAVAAGDKIEIKMVAPTWTTDPAAVRISVTLFFETA